METLLIVDGNAIMHRAYHALPSFLTKKGIHTNVIYGFLNMIYKALEDFSPTHIAICFDTPTQTFRQKLNAEYQSHRPTLNDDFIEQIPILKDLISKAGIYQEEQDGLEADDIIGTIAEKVKKTNMRVLILTGDKDIMQLVNDHIFVIAPKVGLSAIKLYDESEVEKKLGVLPEKIPDYKALAGDPSDNYHGAKGIGPKTAAKLLEKYDSVENLITHIDELEEGRLKDILSSHIKQIEMSKKLATIVRDAEIKFDLDKARFTGFPQELKDEFQKYEMKSLVARFFPDNVEKVTLQKKAKQKKSKTDNHKNQITLF